MLLFLALVATDPYAAPAVPDPELAQLRGGFRLPGGIDVAMTIDTQTAINGAVVLRTVFRAEGAMPSLTVYTPRAGETVAASPHAAGAAGAAGASMPVVTYDRQGGIQVSAAGAAPGVTLTGSGALPAIQDGLEAVTDTVATDAGTVAQRAQGALRVVELTGNDLSVSHIAGGAFGSAIAKAGNDRVIDTQTSVSIDLANAGPDVLGSSMLRAQDITADALRGRF
jgi:hypothetical protein